jgi:hypothetical protein
MIPNCHAQRTSVYYIHNFCLFSGAFSSSVSRSLLRNLKNANSLIPMGLIQSGDIVVFRDVTAGAQQDLGRNRGLCIRVESRTLPAGCSAGHST